MIARGASIRQRTHDLAAYNTHVAISELLAARVGLVVPALLVMLVQWLFVRRRWRRREPNCSAAAIQTRCWTGRHEGGRPVVGVGTAGSCGCGCA